MIISVFSPLGIVTATAASDTFFDKDELSEDYDIMYPIHMNGLPHVLIFWNRFVLVYNCMGKYSFNENAIQKLKDLENKWEQVPRIVHFMPYLKKCIIDNNISIIGIVSAYDMDNDVKSPYVYQILGEDIRRINVTPTGIVNYHCVFLEQKTVIAKLLRKVKIQNGEDWEDTSEPRLRCDLFSIEKSIDFCEFIIKTYSVMENINSNLFGEKTQIDLSIVTQDTIEIKKLTI